MPGPAPGLLLFYGLAYAGALWLGLYLVARNPRDARLLLAGLGLVAYALGLGCDLLSQFAPSTPLAATLTRLHWALHVLPALCWTGTVVRLVPDDVPLRHRLVEGWRYGSTSAAGLLAVGIATALLLDSATARPRAGLSTLLAILVLLPALAALPSVGRAYRAGPTRRASAVILAATLFFALSTALLFLPLGWLPPPWPLVLVTVDLLPLGLAIAAWDAFDQGEAFMPDLLRSLDAALLMVLLFGGQVILAMRLNGGASFPMLVLLLGIVAAAVAIPVFLDPIQGAVDRLALARFPRLRAARADLRSAATALPRIADFDLETLDEAEFARLVRRALSHLGDTARLAASPLTRLPQVAQRLAAQGASGDDVLERAATLRAILTESIARLKPRGRGDFGTSDEWRHYNALYFPYVVGLKPYSRRLQPDHVDPAAQAALEWLRAYVPERTLYNWQNAGARLVAQDLRRRAHPAVTTERG